MSECKCDFRTYMVGDGCEACNPAKALEYAKETIAAQNDEITRLRAELAKATWQRNEAQAELAASRAECERLSAENAALKYSLQLDEDLIGKIKQIISVLTSRPEWQLDTAIDQACERKGTE